MRGICTSIVFAIGAAAAVAAQLKTPVDWRWRLDSPATLVTGQDVPDRGWRFVGMPPGWHVTTGPGVLLFPAARTALTPNFFLEATTFLFPGDSPEEFGIFVGGGNLDAAQSPEYTAFVIRRDGQAAIVRRTTAAVTPLVDWFSHEAVVPHRGGEDAVKNVLRVEADAAAVSLVVNGARVAKVARTEIRSDGAFGFRVGSNINIHISTLDMTMRLAPVPAPKIGPSLP